MEQPNTSEQYKQIIDHCRNIFMQKTVDYGTSWRVYRPISVADQLYIKTKRIRNIQEGFLPRVEEGIGDEFSGIVNYSIVGLMQLTIDHDEWNLPVEEVETMYDETVDRAIHLLHKKNHDYGEAWRDLDVKSITDLIMAKVLRIRQIIQNDGVTTVSEGIDANYLDILNYAVFALILLQDAETKIK